jgi:hypothetical protein
MTYGEVCRRGPCGLAVDIADEGLVDVAGADEATERTVRRVLLWICGKCVPLINVCWYDRQSYAPQNNLPDAYLARTYLLVMCVWAAGAGGGGGAGYVVREIGRPEAENDQACD